MFIALSIVFFIIMLAQRYIIHRMTSVTADAIKMLDALSAIVKECPDPFDNPKTYQNDCIKATKTMSKIAKDCIFEINKKDK